MTRLEISTVNLGTDDPSGLAQFYLRLLGYEIGTQEPDSVIIRDPAGTHVPLAFQLETDHRRPVWPAGGTEQQMQLHLEIRVDDLDAALEHALACGATLASTQPQDDVRVCLDPSGHPFCL